ncbi:MAG: selenocysteine-specific translation elongation factor [Clostridioides sp.]|jgi:selenocysteine-specific elongation factor|nr:selenocysteine-specific translation elongation factor [Clostridioides sp.]
MNDSTHNIIVGTAGHIDHGKTTLIRALTGRETDTLDEEKKRGISINLGFTYFDLPSQKRVGIVDVPGHEKFIKNMLAGASGLDMVLLVVAADEGVMPQTVEHLDILTYLNVKKGIVVLTKSDTVDPELLEMVREDVTEQIRDTFLKDAEIVEVDSISRRGIDELIQKIDKLSEDVEEKNLNSPARLNIDRVFSVKGFGTIVTGTLFEGKIAIDDELIIYPSGIKAKIRSIQVHGSDVKTAYAGQRTAINISNVKVEEIKRGDVLASVNSLEESMMLDVKASVTKHSNWDIKHWERLRLYHGAREILCRAVPLNIEKIGPGEEAFVQFRLEESIVCKKGDKFVLRSYSPMETIGGGVIIDASPKKHKRFDEGVIEVLKVKEKGELKDIIEEFLRASQAGYSLLKEIMSYTGAHEAEVVKAIEVLEEAGNVIRINSMYLHSSKYYKLRDKIEMTLEEYHKKHRLRKGMLKEEVRSKLALGFKTKEMDLLLDLLLKDGVIKISGNYVSVLGFEVKLNEAQNEIEGKIEKRLKSCGFTSILTIEEVLDGNKNYEEVLESMIGEKVEKLDDSYIMDKSIYEDAKKRLIDYIEEHGEITLGEYRDLIDSSRKNCMIILENFDRNRITKRVENKRILM